MLDRPIHQPTVRVPFAKDAPLLMLPGTLCDERVFAPVLTALGCDAAILPLRGASSAAGMAQLVLAGAPERFSLCGFSLGAIVALEIMAQAPERVARLALIGCNPGPMESGRVAARAAVARDDFVAWSCGDADAPRDTPVRRLLDEMAAAVPEAQYRQQTEMTLHRADSWPRLGDIDVPTLVVCGADDCICPPALSRDIALAIAGSRLALIQNAGHYVLVEKPDAVAHELAAWLDQPAQLHARSHHD